MDEGDAGDSDADVDAARVLLPFPSLLFLPQAQQQNDSMRKEFAPLLSDVDAHFAWATEAFECMPEAVNFWMGDDRSSTSFHKDNYENIYVVVTGTKHFVLLPPHEGHRCYMRKYPSSTCRLKRKGNAPSASANAHDLSNFGDWDGDDLFFELEDHSDCDAEVSWSPLDLARDRDAGERARYPRFYSDAWPKPLHVDVHAGDVLYLPALYYHWVDQSVDAEGRCIAVNYWYDMKFGANFAMHNFVNAAVYHEEQEEGGDASSP